MNSPIASSKKRFPIVICLALAGLAIVLAAIAMVLFGNPTVALDLQLDGKPLPLGVIPVVTMNGKPFHSGDKVSVGHNSMSVVLNNAEPINRSVWTFWGAKDLGSISLITFKGNLNLTTTPSGATFSLRQGSDSIRSGIAPATLSDVPVGDYDLLVSCGSYKESKSVTITKGENAPLNIILQIANIVLESSPTDADYVLLCKSGVDNGVKWQGKLPTVMSNVTFGTYTYTVSRKGWETNFLITVDKAGVFTNWTEFPYGSIAVISEPAGLTISTNGVEIGKTPFTLQELKPGQYTVVVSDGENDLTADVSVAPKEAASTNIIFHYGAVQLSSVPAGATVVRKGKEIGKTPLPLNHIPVGESSVEFRLDGYLSTNLIISAFEDAPTNYSVKLINEQYLQAMKKAHDAFDAGQFADSQTDIAAALAIETNDPSATELQDEVSKATAKAEEAARAAQADAKARELASLTWLDFQQVIANCTDTKQIQVPVEKVNISYETYRDYDGKYKQREVKSAPYTVMETQTESTFNPTEFSEKYEGRTFGFNCPGQWAVSKVGQDGSVTFKGTALFDKIVATPPMSNPNAFQSLQKGQKVTIKVVASRIERGFVNTTLYLENAEVLDK